MDTTDNPGALVLNEEEHEKKKSSSETDDDDEDIGYYYYSFNEDAVDNPDGVLNNNQDPEYSHYDFLSTKDADNYLLEQVQAAASALKVSL
jgi:hypothetical protein